MEECEKMFRAPRDFDPSSDLLGYLLRHCPDRVKTTGPYFLGQIVRALHKVIETKNLYDEGNPFIVLCDEELKQIFGVTAFHVSEICTRVTSHLTSPIETDHVIDNSELLDLSQLRSPSWGSDTAKERFTKTFPIETQLFRVRPEFLNILRQAPGADKTRIIFDFNQVVNNFMKYIMENPQKIFDFRNVSVALVEGKPLGEALGIKAFARSQVRGIICSQLLPIPREESLYLYTKTCSCKSEKNLGSATCFGHEKRNSRCKDLVEKSSEDETVYSAQGYETTAIGDCSTSEITSSEDTMSDVYRDQYGMEDSSLDGEETETYFQDSNEDSDIEDVAVDVPLIQISDLSNWADSDRTSDLSQNVSSSEESFSSSSDYKTSSKCIWCKEPIGLGFQYCEACWNEHKSWLAVRQNPRRRKRAAVPKYKSNNRSRTLSDEPERFLNRTVVLGRSISDPSPSTPSEETADVEPTVVTSSSGIGSLSSSQESAFECVPSPYLISSLESQVDNESVTEEKSRKRRQDENIYSKLKKKLCLENMVNSELNQNASTQTISPGQGPSEKLSKAVMSVNEQSALCALCCSRLKDACFVHGRTSHQISCYPCAKKVFKNQKTCPVCRRRIEKITKHFVF